MKTFLFITAFLFHVLLCCYPFPEITKKEEHLPKVNKESIKINDEPASQTYSELLRNKTKGISAKHAE